MSLTNYFLYYLVAGLIATAVVGAVFFWWRGRRKSPSVTVTAGTSSPSPTNQPNAGQAAMQPIIISTPLEKHLSLIPNFNFLAALGILFLVGALGVGTFLVTRPQSQNPQSKAAGSGKTGCSDTCSGDPPDCNGDTNPTDQDPNPPKCSTVTIPGMPDSMDAWGVVNPTYNNPVSCTSRDSQKADCSCQANSSGYCWLGLETLVKNADGQGHRWAIFVYDKATKKLKSGGPTNWVLYDDNGSRKSRWGNSNFFGTDSVLHCGEINEYHEQADLFSPGSWVDTGQVIYAEPTGCNQTFKHKVCQNNACTSVDCSPPTTQCADSCTSNSQCTTTSGTAACQRVALDKDLSAVKLNDTVTATGSGTTTLSGDKIDLIEFIATWNGSIFLDSQVPTTLNAANSTPTLSAWIATQQIKIATAGAYTVQIKTHWLKAGGVDGGWQL